MIRILSIVALAAFVLAAACFAGAAALGGRQLALHGLRLHSPFWLFQWDTTRAWRGPQTTRDIPWSAGRSLTFFHGGDIHFTQGPERKMRVTGPADAVARLRMANGALVLDGAPFGLAPRLRIEASAPDIDTFKILGSARLGIDGYDQDRLNVEIDGDGDIDAAGKARDVNVTIRGSGDVDAGRMAAESARVQILGSGNAAIAPTRAAAIEIAGSGEVSLLSDPPEVDTDIKGSGDVVRHAPPMRAAPPPAAGGRPI